MNTARLLTRNTLATVAAVLALSHGPATHAADFYSETDLVSDRSGAAHSDANLVNAW